jgi:arginyl-tRNA synthetase
LRTVAPGHDTAIVLERPKSAEHGDYACNAALQLARVLKRAPRQIAGELVAALPSSPILEKADIAGAGFINLFLKRSFKQQAVSRVLAAGGMYGTARPALREKVQVEFVSANPTGPLHVGHGRQAALGDAIATLLESQGQAVTREFYYNDAGAQIDKLAWSVQARARGIKPGDSGWPEEGYAGEYIEDIAREIADANDLDAIRRHAVAYLRKEQDADLQAFGVKFDVYYLESSLYADGKVDAAVKGLIANGHTYEKDGALWLRTTDYGDDKDRVMRKSAPAGADSSSANASYTYFVPDVAYHVNKYERGFTKAINIQGGDHHGTIARVRAGVQAAGMGVPEGYPEYVLHKMVTVMKGGQEVKISKRAGSYVTLRDLIDWTSRDAVRFFLLSRKADSEFTFDVDLALKRNDENPVFYVQYAHARICSVIRNFTDQGGRLADAPDLALLGAPTEAALMLELAAFPAVLANAAASLAPHDLTFYLRGLAGAFHSYYGAERVLGDDAALTRARIALLVATRQVIRNALAVLGVSAPERMDRDVEPKPGPASAATP